MQDISENAFLGGKISLRQPHKGYRAGLEAVLLSAALTPKPGESILDVGCGVGTVLLCSSVLHPQCFYTGLERQEDLCQLAEDNIVLNHRQDFCRAVQGSLKFPPSLLKPLSFHQVVTNPPFFKASEATPSPYTTKAQSHVEALSLKEWLHFCVKMLKPRGTLALIYPTSRLNEVLASLPPHMGDLLLLPLWPKEGSLSNRFILKARKHLKTGLTLLPGLVLHETTGAFTPLAQAIMKGEPFSPLFPKR